MLTLRDLAVRPDFEAGPLRVSPSRRVVEGPAGSVNVEPLIMQVFLLLLDRNGQVVTRNELFDVCWGGDMVGDDSLNRAVAKVRRIASEVAPGLLEIETIPRTGYRLRGEILNWLAGTSKSEIDPGSSRLSRRTVIGVAGAATLAAVAGAVWWRATDRSDPQVAELIDQGVQKMRASLPGSDEEAAKAFRAAVELDSRNPRAWGLLALALRNVAEQSEPAEVSRAVMETETAARRALALDPKEPNARTALATVRPEFGNWAATEDALRAILADSPDNVPALTYLTMVLQAVGRAHESWNLNEKTLAADPLSPVPLFRRALKLWIFGKVPEADLASDRALQLWPNNPGVWNARLLIFAFTGRPHAALHLVEDEQSHPKYFSQAAIDFWRVSLRALDSGLAADIAAARTATVEASTKSPYFAVNAMMVLSSLNEVDAAFEVAEGTLLRRGPLIGRISGGRQSAAVADQYWRRTMNLFTPATAAMRADPRFRALCDGMGMIAYWRARGRGPDAMYGLSLP